MVDDLAMHGSLALARPPCLAVFVRKSRESSSSETLPVINRSMNRGQLFGAGGNAKPAAWLVQPTPEAA